MLSLSLALSSALGSSLLATAVVSFLGGIATHVVIRPHEIDSKVWAIFFSYFAVLAHLLLGYVLLCGFSVGKALLKTIIVSNAFNLGLVGSILTYRAFFHRLHRFPGPFPAKLSRFYAMKNAARNLKANEDIQKLHEKYGDFVRVGKLDLLNLPPTLISNPCLGPREISINREAAIRVLYEPPTQCARSPWYSQVSNDTTKISLNSTRDLTIHKNRKRAWVKGLGFRGT
jgi:hypothetical protein